MTGDRKPGSSAPAQQAQFATTHWSLVLQAVDRKSAEARSALGTLCQNYWYPLYAFVRRQGHSTSDAQDLTQAFFARLLEKDELAAVDRSKGRFRTFLLTALGHFLLNEWDKERAVKRGGNLTRWPLNFDAAESRYSLEPSHAQTPEAIFDRDWALALLDRSRSRLNAGHKAALKQEQFDALQVFLTGASDAPTYQAAGERLGMTEGAVKVAVHRLRHRFREILRDEIRNTVATDQEVDEEIQALFVALRR